MGGRRSFLALPFDLQETDTLRMLGEDVVMATWNWWNMSRKHRLLSFPDHFSLIGSTDKRKPNLRRKNPPGISEEGERINFNINILFLIVIGFEYVWKTYMYEIARCFHQIYRDSYGTLWLLSSNVSDIGLS